MHWNISITYWTCTYQVHEPSPLVNIYSHPYRSGLVYMISRHLSTHNMISVPVIPTFLFLFLTPSLRPFIDAGFAVVVTTSTSSSKGQLRGL